MTGLRRSTSDHFGLRPDPARGPVEAAVRRHLPHLSPDELRRLLSDIKGACERPGRGDLAGWAGGVLGAFMARGPVRPRPLVDVLVDSSVDPVRLAGLLGGHRPALDVAIAILQSRGWTVIEIRKDVGSWDAQGQ